MGKTGDLLVQILLLLFGVFVVLWLVNLFKQGSTQIPLGSPDAAQAAGSAIGNTVGAGAVGFGGGLANGGFSAGTGSVLDLFAGLFGTNRQGYVDDFGAGLKEIGSWFGHPEWFDNGTTDQGDQSSYPQGTGDPELDQALQPW